jgi:hypothetical protein
VVESATFLAPLHLELALPNGITIEINEAKLSAHFEASSFDDVLGVVEIIEHHYSAYLSLLAGVYVSIETISGQIDRTEVTFELTRLSMRSQVTIEARRQEHVVQALSLASLDSARRARMLFAALYYQQAVRLLSPLDVRVPSLNLAEVVVNLTKALEVLFGSKRDSMREGLRSIGLTDAQIEAQVIPLILARNQLDGAHPVGTHVEEELLTVLHHYVERAMTNMRAVLILAAKTMQEGKASIGELESGDVRERVKLLSLMKEYLTQPPIQAD